MDRIWEPNRHITQLDGLRGLAILIVTCFRFTKTLPSDCVAGSGLRGLFFFGERGVDLFFVLSGFLITGVLLDARNEKGVFRNFLARRALRIFPLYYSAIAILLLLSATPAFHGMFSAAADRQFFLWTYLTNVQMSVENSWCFGYLDHFWSLAVEEHFYLLWPLLVLALPPKRLLPMALVLAAMAAITRIGFTALSSNDLAPDVFSLFRFDALLIGSSIAIVARHTGLLKRGFTFGICLAAVCIAIGVAMKLTGGRLLTIPHSVWAMIWAGVLIALISSKPTALLARAFDCRPLRTLGKYSYAMYVFQNPLIPLVASVVSVSVFEHLLGSRNAACVVYPLAMFGLTMGAALLSWYIIEQPILKLKKYFPMQSGSGETPRPRGYNLTSKTAS